MAWPQAAGKRHGGHQAQLRRMKPSGQGRTPAAASSQTRLCTLPHTDARRRYTGWRLTQEEACPRSGGQAWPVEALAVCCRGGRQRGGGSAGAGAHGRPGDAPLPFPS